MADPWVGLRRLRAHSGAWHLGKVPVRVTGLGSAAALAWGPLVITPQTAGMVAWLRDRHNVACDQPFASLALSQW